MTPAIETRGLVKAFGEHHALDGLDLTVEPGSVFGFLGPNGSGKTTTLRVLLGLARPTAGTAKVLGHDAGHPRIRHVTGYLPDVPGFPAWMTARQVLELYAGVFGLPRDVARRRVGSLLDLAGLADVTSKVGAYSRGMRQRLGIAQALVNAPDVLLLDEPTSALDPLGRRSVLDLVAGLRGRTTVFFSTHILSDAERVCDTVAIVDAGRVVAAGPLDEVREGRTVQRRLLVETDDPARLRAALADEPWVSAVTEGTGPGALEVTTAEPERAALGLPALVARLGLGLTRLEPVEPSLEDVFVGLVGVTR
ncbi:MAG: ABC transporter ATP-binding protein [Micrococcales bacterium]|nr:ABC transporter ATP-binding protein [Micrococcales bacterium]